MRRVKTSKITAWILLVVIACIGGYLVFSKNSIRDTRGSYYPTSELDAQYRDISKKYILKYEAFSDAATAFKIATNPKMEPTGIVMYVPGKIPHEDGDPYVIGRGVIDQNKNDCIVGYMNLVTGFTESHRDVCVIYN